MSKWPRGLGYSLDTCSMPQFISMQELRAWLRATAHVQEATMNRTGGEALSGMSNGRRAACNSLDTRKMVQFILLQPSLGIEFDKSVEEVLAKVCFVKALRVGQFRHSAACRTCWTATWRLSPVIMSCHDRD